ncbi:MAG: AMP-binding protein, partial [Phycisphaerae bacterium]
MSQEENLVSSMVELRRFEPPADFAEQAHIGSMDDYRRMWQRSIDDPEGFWGEVAEQFHWFKQPGKVLEFTPPDAKWFVGGQTNLAYNCLDRIIEAGRGQTTAIVYEGEAVREDGTPETTERITYNQLLARVCRFANALKGLGVKKGDVVTIYMPMVPDAAVAMLACARIGAPHSVIFGGFSSQAIADRVNDANSRIIVTADGGSRRGRVLDLKKTVDEACKLTDKVQKVVVLKHAGNEVTWHDARDAWWHELTADQPATCPAEPMDSEDLAFVLYTSGSTGKPKGVVHTTGGYLVYASMTHQYVFDYQPGEVYWCTADVGWVTGHSYIVYGPLANGATTVMFEGVP